MQSATSKQILAYLILFAAVALGKAIGNDMQFAFYFVILLPIRLMYDIREANRIFPYKWEFNRSLLRNQWFLWWLLYGLWCAVSHLGRTTPQ